MKKICTVFLCAVCVATAQEPMILSPAWSSIGAGKHIALNGTRTLAFLSGTYSSGVVDTKSGNAISSFNIDAASVVKAIFTPNGNKVATLNNRNEVRVWETESGRLLSLCIGEYANTITYLQISSDATRLVIGYSDKTFTVWNTELSKKILEVKDKSYTILNSPFVTSADYLVTSTVEGKIALCNLSTAEFKLLNHEVKLSEKVFFNRSANIIAIADANKLRLLESNSGIVRTTINTGYGVPTCITFNEASDRIVAIYANTAIQVWDLVQKKVLNEITGLTTDLSYAEINRSGTRIVTIDAENSVRLWNLATNTVIKSNRTHKLEVKSAGFIAGGDSVISIGGGSEIKVWNSSDKNTIENIEGYEGVIEKSEFCKSGNTILATDRMSKAKIWDSYSGRIIKALEFDKSDVFTHAAVSNSGENIALIKENTIYVADAGNGALQGKITNKDERLKYICYSHSDDKIVGVCSNKIIKVWNSVTGKELLELKGHTGEIMRAYFSADDTYILSFGNDGMILCWNASDGTLVQKITVNDGTIKNIAISPSGNECISYSRSKTKVWSIETGQLLRVYEGNVGAISPNGVYIAIANESMVTVWNMGTGERISSLIGHLKEITSLNFNKNGTRIVTASADNTARIWSTETGVLMAILVRHNGSVTNAVFENNGGRVLTASEDGTIKMWDAKILGLYSDIVDKQTLEKSLIIENMEYADNIAFRFTSPLLYDAQYELCSYDGSTKLKGTAPSGSDNFLIDKQLLTKGVYFIRLSVQKNNLFAKILVP